MAALDAKKVFEQILAFLRGLTLRQRVLLGVSAVIVAVTLWIFVALIGKTEFRTLYSGLAPAEAQSLTSRLAAQNIRYELSPDGTSLRVPADQLDRVRMDLAAQGLPQTGRLGFELFDKPNWAGSDFAEKVNYQRALEGELERTIQTVNDVEAVRVHLVLPRQSVFSEREREAKASVVLKLRTRQPAEQAAKAISQLVASAVDGLRAENVTVVSSDGELAPGPRFGPLAGTFDEALTQKLVSTLAPVVGADHVKASVSVEMDLSTSEDTSETYNPNQTVILTSQKSEEGLGGTMVAGIPGTASNIPVPQSPTAAAGAQSGAAGLPKPTSNADNQVQRTESQTYAVSKTVRHVQQPPGGIRRIAAAVLVDDAIEITQANGKRAESRRRRTPEEMKQLESLASAAIGLDASRGDRLSIENLAFQTAPAETPEAPSGAQKWLLLGQRWMFLLRYAALLALFGVVYLLLLRPVKKQILATFAPPQPALAPAGLPGAVLPPAEQAEAGEKALQEAAAVEDELNQTNSEVKRAVVLKRTLVDKIKQEPAAAGRLIQHWLQQGEAE